VYGLGVVGSIVTRGGGVLERADERICMFWLYKDMRLGEFVC